MKKTQAKSGINFETTLGADSHMGSLQIAACLPEHVAGLDIFAAAIEAAQREIIAP